MFQQQYSLGRWIIKSNCCPSTLISVEYLRSQALSLSLPRYVPCCLPLVRFFAGLIAVNKYTPSVCVCVHVCCQPVLLVCCFVIVFIFVLLNRAIHVAAVQLQNRCLYSAQIKTTKGITRATAATTLTATTPAVATTAVCCMLTFMLHALWLHLSGILLVTNCSGFKYSIHAGDWLHPLRVYSPSRPEADEANLKPNAQHIGKCKNCVIFKLAALDLICQSAVGQGGTRRRRWAWETAGGDAALRSLALVLGFAVVVVAVSLPFLFTNMQKRNCVLSCLC